jgi:hypothetical protein
MLKRIMLGVMAANLNSGCAARIPAEVLSPMSIAGAAPAQSQPDGPPEMWRELRKLAPGTRVAVYLENGGRMVQTLRSVTDDEIVLDVGSFRRREVVVVAAAPTDRLLNGVLTGAAIGIGVGLGYVAAFRDDGDFSGASAAGGAIYGLAVGSGFGAMLDAGTATPDRPIYLRSSPAPAAGGRHWKLEIPAAHLHGWITGRKVELMLRDGTYLKGRAATGDEQSVRIAVSGSSNRSLRGREADIPASQVSTVYYRVRIGGNRFAAGLGGALTGILTGVLLGAFHDNDQGGQHPIGIVIGGGLGVLLGSTTGLGVAEHYNLQEITLLVK